MKYFHLRVLTSPLALLPSLGLLLFVQNASAQTRAPQVEPNVSKLSTVPASEGSPSTSKDGKVPDSEPKRAVPDGAAEATPAKTDVPAKAIEEAAGGDAITTDDQKPPPPQIEQEADAIGGKEAANPYALNLTKGQSPPPENTPEAAELDPATLPFTYHQLHFDLAIGAQIASAQNNGLEPFMSGEVLPEVFFRAGGVFYQSGPFALALNGELGLLTRHSTIRQEDTRLALTRLNLGAEGRYHFHHRLFASLRLAPGVEHASIRAEDAEVSYEDDSWKFAFDASAGLAFRFAGSSDGRQRSPRAWVFLEGGAHFAGEHSPVLDADGRAPQRPEAIVLDPFKTSGPFLSLGLMASY